MGLFDRRRSDAEPQAEAAPERRGEVVRLPPRRRVRNFAAAMVSRLTGDWSVGTDEVNDQLRGQLGRLRRRARDASRNNPLARRYIQLVRTHVVGPQGFKLQVRGRLANGNPDTRGNGAVAEGWARWSKRGVCELTGRQSLVGLLRQHVTHLARDGEGLLRLRDIRPTTANPFGFVLEQLDPVRLDEALHSDLANGNRIRMGVELDPSGRPVAYHLRRHAYGSDPTSAGLTHDRVPAVDIIHHFVADGAEEIRGWPWLATSLKGLHDLHRYDEAAIVAARNGASQAGFFETPDGLGSIADRQGDAEEHDQTDFEMEVEPGVFRYLPPGAKFVPFTPDYPHQAYDGFTRAQHRRIAVGLGVSYHALTGDLEAVNYSSIRSGTLEEREHWRVLQDDLAGAVLDRIYRRWLGNALAFGAIEGLPQNLDAGQAFERYARVTWQGRRWPWVDPGKDADAAIKSIREGLSSRSQVLAERGGSIEETFEDLSRERELAERLGIVITDPQRAPAAAPPAEEPPDA